MNRSQLQAVYVPGELLAWPDTISRSSLENCSPPREGSIPRYHLAMADYPICIPLRRKLGSHRTKRTRKQAPDICECISLYMCVCVLVCNQQVSLEWGRNARASHCSALPRVDFPAAALASAGSGEPKKIRLRLFSLGASNRIPIPRLLSLSILVSNTINFPLQSRELLHDRIHIAVNSLSLNADRSFHSFNHDGQPCEALDSCSRFLNSSITQGKA